MKENDDGWISSKGAARYLGYSSTGTIRNKVSSGELRAQKRGKGMRGRLFFRQAWLDEYLAKKEQKP